MTEPTPAPAEAAEACARPAPPVGKRFQPGHSGNPKGGPKRPARRTAEIEWLFRREFDVPVDGETQRLPLARALLLAQAERALKGDARATSELLALLGDAEKTRAAETAARVEAARRREAARREAAMTAELRTLDARLEEEVEEDAADFCAALAELGAVRVTHDGVPQVRRWVYDAAVQRDPGLRERLMTSGSGWEAGPDPPA